MTTTCHRHPGTEATIRCQRCDRPICTTCMISASVGFQCPDCVADGRKSVRQPRTMAGGLVPNDPGRISLILIGLNVAVFIAQSVSPPVYGFGALVGVDIAGGEYWRLFTCAFLHNGVLHLLFNMYALYLFGPMAERALGPARFVLSYVTLMLAGSVFVYWLANPMDITSGASGAIFGLFGVVLILMIKTGQDIRTLLVLLVINAFISLSAHVSWQGHLGGFLAGVVLGAVFAYAPRASRTAWQVAVFVGLWCVLVVGVVLRTAELTSGITSL